MITNGTLDETPLQELLRQLAADQRTGTLHLVRGALRARIGFRDGQPVSARAPGLQRLGELLVSAGYADPIKVRTAARIQAEERGRRPIGQILLSTGVVSSAQLESVVRDQIRETLQALASWSGGLYRFEAGEVPAFDDIRSESGAGASADPNETSSGSTPGDSTRPPSAAKAADKGARGRGRTTSSSRSSAAENRPGVTLRSSDSYFAERIHEAVLAADLEIHWNHQRDRGEETRDAASIRILDLRHGEGTARELTAQRRRFPRSVILAVIDRGAASDPVYAAGAVSVLPPDPRTIAFALRNLLQALASTHPSSALPEHGGSTVRSAVSGPTPQTVDRLYAAEAQVGDSASSSSATAALDLMQAISMLAERAILFLLRRKDLLVAGAFGVTEEEKPLAELTRGLRIPLADAGQLRSCIESGMAMELARPENDLPAVLRDWIGKPAAGMGVVLPISGGALPVGLVYADNGSLTEPISNLTALSDAAARFGPSLETEILIGEAARTLI